MAARETKAYSVSTFGEPLKLVNITLPALKSHEVEVKIKACGICLSDVDIVEGKYSYWKLPCVAGHEGVGEITAVGEDVKTLKIGQLVGCGVWRDSCGNCSSCNKGKDNACAHRELMFQNKSGCFAEYVHIDYRYAFPIPDGYPFEYAGVLMCAGQTTFAPFQAQNILPGHRVGVFGVGGLGHLAIMLAKAYGTEVTAISTSLSKEEDCKKLGSKYFVNVKDPESVKARAGSLDFVLSTAPASDWGPIFQLLAPGGKLIIIGAATSLNIPVMDLVMNQKAVVGSAASNRGSTTDMLRFVHLHSIFPQIEKFPFSQINEAIQRVKENKVRYRAVCFFD
eukprot:TRINITY_DN4535_c0_g1_i1.p1 TRINITY_DN4535_c0_g1~~TRINITY_DN4535_c0_g1_i1.p1  ORF type:complete len:337 (+),score=107.06 TRINITY_DN4535_c0_g1_i1:110-1120(+)